MRGAVFFSLMFFIFVIFTLFFYYFLPSKPVVFNSIGGNSNFSLNSFNLEEMQFYPNMRFPNSYISYNIHENCPLQKKNDMERAFKIIADLTNLTFSSVVDDAEISIACDSKSRIEQGLFVAGEGGPTNITKTNNFYLILHGSILLIRNSECPTPNIALHELIHVLGFGHSVNPNNIMYNISKCGQIIGEDTINAINSLYSVPSYPDLSFENVSAVVRGSYLDLNMSVRNNGLKNSQKSSIKIYADDSLVKEIELKPLEVGYGRSMSLVNLWMKKRSPDEINIEVETSFEELNKENNKIILKVKK